MNLGPRLYWAAVDNRTGAVGSCWSILLGWICRMKTAAAGPEAPGTAPLRALCGFLRAPSKLKGSEALNDRSLIPNLPVQILHW